MKLSLKSLECTGAHYHVWESIASFLQSASDFEEKNYPYHFSRLMKATQWGRFWSSFQKTCWSNVFVNDLGNGCEFRFYFILSNSFDSVRKDISWKMQSCSFKKEASAAVADPCLSFKYNLRHQKYFSVIQFHSHSAIQVKFSKKNIANCLEVKIEMNMSFIQNFKSGVLNSASFFRIENKYHSTWSLCFWKITGNN